MIFVLIRYQPNVLEEVKVSRMLETPFFYLKKKQSSDWMAAFISDEF